MDPDDVIIQVIKRSRVRTMVMITQIETCVDILRVKMTDKNQPEKYEVIYRLYLDKTRSKIPWSERIKAVAQELYCSTDSVRRWRKEMIDELSILIFGIDGLKLDI